MAANNKLSIKLKNFKNSGSYSRGVSVCLHKLKEKTLTQKNITERTVKKKIVPNATQTTCGQQENIENVSPKSHV